jgi:hypothetical protein
MMISFRVQLCVQLAKLLVRPEQEGGVLDALALDLEDEDVVLLGGVAFLDVVHADRFEAAVRVDAGNKS